MIIFLQPQAIFSLSCHHDFNLVSSCDTLKLLNIAEASSHLTYSLDFIIAAKELDCSRFKIKTLSLELPIHKLTFSNTCYFNQLGIYCLNHCDYALSDFHNQLANSPKILIPISADMVCEDVLSINLTNLLLPSSNQKQGFYHIIVQVEHPGLTLRICNHNEIASPKLKINYSNDLPINPSKGCSMLFTSINQKQKLMIQNEVILFDHVFPEKTHVISYAPETGRFTFLKTGFYVFHWLLNLQGTTSISCINIGLLNITTHKLLEFNSPCVLPNQISGQQMIQVLNVNEEYELINASAGSIQFSNLPLQASLTLFKTN